MHLPGYFEFYCRVKTIAGHNALEKIPDMLLELKAQKPLVLTDKGVTGAGLIDILIEAVKDKINIAGIEDDIPPDSELKVVNHLARVYKEKGCDSIIAVGGGSVLDTAKGVNVIVSEESDNLMDFCGAGKIKRRLNPFLAIPTTSGTGSEVTLAAVIADRDNNRKMAFSSYFLLPDVAVLDSRMTLTLPPFLTSATAMDALTHAIEAYTCLAKNPLSDAYAVSAISLISKNLVHVVKNPRDKDGRLALAIAANLAGISFSNSMVGVVHTLGHSVGGVCHVPHGNCMAIFLPYALEYNMHKIAEFTAEVLLPLAGPEVFAATPPADRAEKVIQLVRQMNQDLYDATDGRHPRNLKEVKDREGNPMVPLEKLEEIAKTSLGDGSLIYNPEDMDFEDAMNLLKFAWEGIPMDRSLIKKG